jgi:hypothetical protein
MTYETELKPGELSADDLDAVVGGEDIPATYDLKAAKKVAAPEPRPGIIAIL